MDSYHEHPSDFELPSPSEVTASEDVTAAIGSDERRMHVRAYNHWVSLLDGREFPSIEDLEPADVTDFAGNSVLLDFTCGRDNPAVPYIGAAIRDECGLDDDTRAIADVPSRSLLSRLTDHYLQIIANRAPIGFEAEFANQRDETICYRGILMPFSSDGDTIDFIYGVINWKRVGAAAEAYDAPPMPSAAPVEELDPASVAAEEPLELTDALDHETFDGAEEPLELSSAEQETDAASLEHREMPVVQFAGEQGEIDEAEPADLPTAELDDNAGLADRLWAARETAEAVKAGEGRTRAALYRALSLAYDFALAAQANAEDYAELLEESGVKAQARAPMTPIVKLVFGIDYDKARLTEFAAALSFALRECVPAGAFEDLIEKRPGGLKALVAAERQARSPEPKLDTKSEAARARLRSAHAITLADVPSEDEFALVVTRRGADGRHELVAIIDDESLVERAIRRAA